MGFFTRSSSACGDCGVTGGHHARGCPQAGGGNFARGSATWATGKKKAREGQRRTAEEFVKKYKDTRFTTYTTNGPGSQKLPKGTKMERTMFKDPRTRQWERGYKIVMDEDDLDR